jgi:hypothetical protein
MLGEAYASVEVARYFGYEVTLRIQTYRGLRDIQIRVAAEDATLKPGAQYENG